MDKLTQHQIMSMESYIMENGRDLEKAKWNNLFKNATNKAIETALLNYQNSDGGFGNGLESDILMPHSSSIASTEAIYIAFEYKLNCKGNWFKKLLDYFEDTMCKDDKLLSFWEKVPKKVDQHPHAPWWNYAKESRFSPNPSAAVASAFIKYGNNKQKELGYAIAKRCIDFLKSDEPCYQHDFYCLQVLVENLQELKSDLIDAITMKHMERRLLGCLCTDSEKWMEYEAQPLDIVDDPSSQWFKLVEPYIEKNIRYWLDTLTKEGYWQPNFSWGDNSKISKQVTVYWQCTMAVKRTRILKNFGLLHSS